MRLYHDSHHPDDRSPGGAQPCKTPVTLRLTAEEVDKATLRVWWQSREELFPMTEIAPGRYEATISLPDSPGLMWYYFIGERNGERLYLGNAMDGMGGAGVESPTEPKSYQITVYDPAYRTPEWLRDGAMMQIFPDRFRASHPADPALLPPGGFYHARWDEDPILVADDRSGDYLANDFFGGDLKGIEEKLDYIAGLGVTVLYLNPVFQSASNHRYNTGDYHRIDPMLGTEADFASLCRAAGERGIRVVLDGVFSHTGSDSRYFNKNGNYGSGGAYRDEHSPYEKWYRFERWPEKYDCWWGIKTLPNVNEMEPSYRRYIISDADSVIAHWMRAGASGWRLDVADELPMDFLRQLRSREKGLSGDAALIGEVWEDPSNKVAYGEERCYCLGDTLDSTMNYPLRDAVLLFLRCRIGAGAFVRRVESMLENWPKPFLYSQMNLLGSHDKPRALAVLAEAGDLEPDRSRRHAFDLSEADYRHGKRRLIAAWRTICAMPGIPCVYYGDEAGLYGMTDPFCRGTYPWGCEDEELIGEYRDALSRRRASMALRTGETALEARGSDVVLIRRAIRGGRDAFGRAAADETAVLAVNRAAEARTIEWNGGTLSISAESAVWLEEKINARPAAASEECI